MIRAIAVTSLVTLLILVLYLPSAHPPERFLAQLRTEHVASISFWGPEAANRILNRALRLQGDTAQITPLPKPSATPDNATAQEMSAMNRRLFNNPYFRSIDALLLLASYRAAVLLEWLPWLAGLIAVMVIDASLQRRIKAKEFRQHDPELFALYAGLGIFTACASVLACAAPVTWHPMVMPLLPLVVGLWGSLAWGHYHRRG
ncbi:DUF4400 domain-containing protein [Pseudomonas sp. 18175]|uniref:DUF4400 domain-containing protein n=1 Tax=Pseudomonas sp. 18175 TaxID=3390056 RepID=UPI003D1A5B61